ncbi:hypothetical protein V491_07530 [Pseudogymnoascus sp. VKM F-3775]|nr:hypothetical protein V491_07530 [Pseudogymnoascus sp. VKM F-3775]
MFNDDELLWEAVQASGSNVAHIYPEGNKRLAMIGDVVLKLVVLEDLRPQNMNRGSMDTIVQRTVKNPELERIGRQNNLEQLVNVNPSQQGIVPSRTITDTFEAVIGAVYLDSGKDLESVRLVIARLGLWGQEPEQLASL